jgi:hypothetical protein
LLKTEVDRRDGYGAVIGITRGRVLWIAGAIVLQTMAALTTVYPDWGAADMASAMSTCAYCFCRRTVSR